MTVKPGIRTNATVPPVKKIEQPELPAPAEKAGSINFIQHVWNTPVNRKYFLAGLLLNIILFIAYKYCYPLPDIWGDGQSYIYAAVTNNKSYYRPFGYSRFLQIIHDVAGSHYATVALQYFVLVLAALFSFFTVDYLYRFKSKRIKFCSWLFVTLNPCLIVLANIIQADAIFIAFSAIWFTLFLWIIKRKQWWSLVVQLFFLYASFQIRYNALYYPVITGFVFLFSPGMKLPYKLTGIFASFLLIFNAYTNVKRTNYETTGANVFAGFSGWQMASNALLIYKKADIKTEDFDDPELKLLDQFTKHFIDSIDIDYQRQIEKDNTPLAVFLWDKNSPLKKYLFYYINTHRISYLPGWYYVAPVYNEYGWHIVKRNPGLFFRHYLMPNFITYIVPPPEVMGEYDVGKSEMTPMTSKWLHLKENKLHAAVPGVQEKLMYPYAAFHAILLLFCLVVPLAYLWKCRKRQGSWSLAFVVPVMLWYLFLGADMAFSTFASPIVLRYVTLLFIIGFGLPFYFLDQVLDKSKETETR